MLVVVWVGEEVRGSRKEVESRFEKLKSSSQQERLIVDKNKEAEG